MREPVLTHDVDILRRALAAGEIVAIPTARWYMMCCVLDHESAIELMYQAKGRPREKALLELYADVESAARRARFSGDARRLAAVFWPGDLVLELPSAKADADGVHLVMVPAGALGDMLTSTPGLALHSTAVSFSHDSPWGPAPPAETPADVVAFHERSGVEPIAAVLKPTRAEEELQVTHLTIVRCSAGDSAIVREGTLPTSRVREVLGS